MHSAASRKIENESRKMEVGRWKSEDGSQKMEVGRWKSEDGSRKMEDRCGTLDLKLRASDFKLKKAMKFLLMGYVHLANRIK